MATIAFSAEGEQLTAFRDALRTRHYPCTAQQIRGGVFYAQTKAHNWYGIRTAAAEFQITLTILRKRGLRFRLYPYRKRVCGIAFGLLCGFAFLYWCESRIHSIEIYGNTTVSDTEILSQLASLGIARGIPYRDIDFTAAEQQMRLRISDLEWIAMRHTGGRLVVDLREETKPPAMLHDHIPTNYVATVSAQITQLHVLGGHAQVKVGDAVREGDVIITGVQEDLNGVTRFYHADGLVRGVYEYDFECFQPYCGEITVSGKTDTAPFLDAFGLRIPLSVGFTPPPEPFIYTEITKPLELFGRRAPFAFVQCRYTRKETAVTAYSPAELDALLAEQAARFEQNFHKNDKIVSKQIVTSETDLGILLKIHYIFEGVVGETREIFVKLS